MFKNVYYDTKKSIIHLWEQLKGENFYSEIPWTPYVFIPAKEGDEDARTIFGKPVQKQTFDSYYDYNSFLKDHKNPSISENNVRNDIQFLSERYYGIPDEEMEVPKLLIYYLDIEVRSKEGFPNVKKPDDEIILISVRNSNTNLTVTFGYDSFNNKNYDYSDTNSYSKPKNVKYIKCENEDQLLRRFFNFMNKYPCDVLSGYNVWWFDIPYIINRSIILFGEELGKKLYQKMSPINVVSVWNNQSTGNMNVDIAGMTVLDYYDVYRMYGKNLERYTLDFVSKRELNVGKLPNPYGSLNELADKEWSRFTDYNIIDCERVHDLENQLGFIRMIQALSLLCKSPMRNYNAQTQLIEGLMLTFFRRNRLCAPYFEGGEKEPFRAAYIKEPQRGLHKWVVDVDITSSYPSHIITLNMSIETFFGRIVRLQEDEIAYYTKKREFPEFKFLKIEKGEQKIINVTGKLLKNFNLSLKKGLLAIAPCGSVFFTKKPGVISIVQKTVFFKRQEVKNLMKKCGKKSNECNGIEKEEFKEKERRYDSLQKALKIMMNAFYGILSVPYSRYHNINIAKAITSCARRTIRNGEIFSNYILNNPNEELSEILNEIGEIKKHEDENKDYIIYIHTDSLFLRLNDFILDNIKNYKKWDELSDNSKIEYIKRISLEIEKYVNNRIFNETQLLDYNSQVLDFKIKFKQEIIAKTMLVVQKSKYAYWLLNKEGVPKDEIEVTGLELIRSETAEAIRPKLKNVLKMIMMQASDDDIMKNIRICKKELNKLEPEDLAANIGINGINKYLSGGIPKKGTPWHVKGVYGYRILLKELGIKNKYEDIYEGLKSKVVYVKKNPYNVETIAFHEWPKEFNNIVDYDKEKMIEKFFINKVRFLLHPINKEFILDCDMSGVKTFF